MAGVSWSVEGWCWRYFEIAAACSLAKMLMAAHGHAGAVTALDPSVQPGRALPFRFCGEDAGVGGFAGLGFHRKILDRIATGQVAVGTLPAVIVKEKPSGRGRS